MWFYLTFNVLLDINIANYYIYIYIYIYILVKI